MTTQANQVGTVIPNYTGNVRVSARRCMPLALRLAQTAPSDISSEERERLAAVHARGLEAFLPPVALPAPLADPATPPAPVVRFVAARPDITAFGYSELPLVPRGGAGGRAFEPAAAGDRSGDVHRGR